MTTAPIVRITSDGAWRTTDATGGGFPATGSVRITGLEDVPEFDVDSVIHDHFPGLVVQANLVAAVTAWLITHGTVNDEDEAAILALANAILAGQPQPPTLPATQELYAPVPYPAGLRRFPDSNPATDGWSIVSDFTTVRGDLS